MEIVFSDIGSPDPSSVKENKLLMFFCEVPHRTRIIPENISYKQNKMQQLWFYAVNALLKSFHRFSCHWIIHSMVVMMSHLHHVIMHYFDKK